MLKKRSRKYFDHINMVVRMRFLKASVLLLLFFLYGCSEAETVTAEPPELSLSERAEQGDPEAQFSLGWMYAEGEGVPQDHREAVKWYRLAAEQGLARAQVSLGLSYDRGEGVPQDQREAVKWYRLAAEQGDVAPRFNLGMMYAKGEGVPQDYRQAYAWFNISGAQGLKEATKNRDNVAANLDPEPLLEAQVISRTYYEIYNK